MAPASGTAPRRPGASARTDTKSPKGTKPRARAKARAGTKGPARSVGSIGRARLAFVGAVVVSAIVLFAWFPAGSLLSQRSSLHGAESELSTLHAQDSALAQEKKNLSDTSEIGRIAREQDQLVNPGQQPYEVLPPSGAAAAGTPYAGDPGLDGPVTPSATAELPPGGVTTTTAPATTATTLPASKAGTKSDSGATSSGGFVSRVVQSLEFWR